YTVAFYVGWLALGGSHHFVINHQYSEIVAGNKFLYNYPARYFGGMLKGGNGLSLSFYVNGSAPAVVAIQRFKHQRKAHLFNGIRHLRGRGNGNALGYRY